MSNNPSSVQAAPNQSLVIGKILSIAPLKDEPGFIWEILVEEVESERKMADFAANRKGLRIEVLVRPDFEHNMKAGDKISARITFQGDERGGTFFLVKDEAQKID
jgi:hypothetical protein